jgi:hypothetical protein
MKHEGEAAAVMAVFVGLWMVIPWEPLTAWESVWAVASVVAIAWGVVMGAVCLVEEVISR